MDVRQLSICLWPNAAIFLKSLRKKWIDSLIFTEW